MASRSHVDVNERRLRPIYDCLDNGNNKKAIQEADKVLKKQKDLQCAKVLKALALLRLGRQDDSSGLLQEIHAQHPTDEATLQAMSICYRELYKLELIADLYENAHKNRPDNEDILSFLFMAYVRLGDYKKQQQTAMLLHKLQPQKNPYYFWAIMSIVMQAHTCKDSKLAKTMFLPLAERMTQKFINDGKVNAEAEVQLYLIVLELLQKWEEALELVLGSLGEKFNSEINFRELKTAELCTKLERWPETNAAYKKLLKNYPDHWDYWQNYISSCLKCAENGVEPVNDSSEPVDVDYNETMAAAFIEECVKSCESGRPLRGPYLARMELLKQMKLKNRTRINLTEPPLKLLQEYFTLFGDKYCCFGDMKLFLDLLDSSEQIEFITYISQTLEFNQLEESSIKYPLDAKQMQRHLTILQLKRYLGMYDKCSVEEKISLAKELLDRYKHGLQFGKTLLKTEVQFSDNYLLLAIYLLLDIWQQSGDSKLVWQAIVQLEKGVENSSSNFRIKFLLMRLYCIMGAYGPCHVLYESMEVKHIMNDTIGHTIFNHIKRLGHFSVACTTYGAMLRFFAVNHKETTEYLIASYKYGSFNKINEFVEFRERLQNSLQYASATVESMLLDLILETTSHPSTEQMVTYMEIDPEKDKTAFSDLSDNRDLDLMECWDPPERCNMKEMQEKSFAEEKMWLKFRNLTLRILAATVKLGQQAGTAGHMNNGVGNGAGKSMPEILYDLLEQLKKHIEDCKEFCSMSQYPLQGPYPTQLSNYLSTEHCHVFVDMIENILYIQSLHEEGLDKIDNEKEERLKDSVPSKLNTGACHRILKPLKTKKSKKKKGGPIPTQPGVFDHYSALLKGLEKATKDLHEAVRDLDPDDSSVEKELWKKVEKSYQQSSREVSELLHNKLQYLATLQL
ncbi:hypothetical protein KUTeg_010343 [Tegillarca granosa]|uniref:N-terminal acetyltransferase B complex subunit NAA25 homolog n=1 Tax=Tegillarca granosa TaxID=220873 RepID=A0ABQ9F9L0_TEGGR|nr:hypothetical protein KUTeg_010343 [Tegillarca granosa]